MFNNKLFKDAYGMLWIIMMIGSVISAIRQEWNYVFLGMLCSIVMAIQELRCEVRGNKKS